MARMKLNYVELPDGGYLQELYKCEGWGQLTMRVIPPGTFCGYHHHPWNEKWWIVKGNAKIRVRPPGGKQKTYSIRGQSWETIDVPAGAWHVIATGAEPLILLWHSDKIYDPEDA